MILDEFMLRCSINSDIQQHLPRLKAEASTGDAVVIELGVRSGNSTVAFLAAAEAHGGFVHSVDIGRPPVPWWGHPCWKFYEGDDITLVDSLPEECDVLFIDTSHHYQHTLDELYAYVPKVVPGGVVLMHDTELERPDGAPAGDPPYPVRKAIDEFCATHDLTPEYVGGCWGLGVIRIPGGESV